MVLIVLIKVILFHFNLVTSTSQTSRSVTSSSWLITCLSHCLKWPTTLKVIQNYTLSCNMWVQAGFHFVHIYSPKSISFSLMYGCIIVYIWVLENICKNFSKTLKSAFYINIMLFCSSISIIWVPTYPNFPIPGIFMYNTVPEESNGEPPLSACQENCHEPSQYNTAVFNIDILVIAGCFRACNSLNAPPYVILFSTHLYYLITCLIHTCFSVSHYFPP